MNRLEKFTEGLNRLLIVIGGLFLLAMVILTCGNILLRIVWAPIPGTFELMGFFGAMVAAMALGYTQIKRGHIAVDVLIMTFSKKNRRRLNVLNGLLGAIFIGLCTWQLAGTAATIGRSGEVTETLRIIYHPFIYAVALGFGILALVFVVDLVRAVRGKKEDWE